MKVSKKRLLQEVDNCLCELKNMILIKIHNFEIIYNKLDMHTIFVIENDENIKLNNIYDLITKGLGEFELVKTETFQDCLINELSFENELNDEKIKKTFKIIEKKLIK